MSRNAPLFFFCCSLLLASSLTRAYLVHEEPEENDETTSRGKRQESSTAVIDSIFNIPVQVIKQTSAAAQTLSPQNAGTIDSVLKIPIATLEAVSSLIKNRQENRYQDTTPLSPTRPTGVPKRRADNDVPTTENSVVDERRRYRDEIRRRYDLQREQQRVYLQEIQRRRFVKMMQHNRLMQQQIQEEAEKRRQQRFYRGPFSFNALSSFVDGPQHTFNGHAGHGDGHVYQYYDQQKPLHFGQRRQDNEPIPTKSTLPISSTTVGSTDPTNAPSTSSRPTTTTTSNTSPARPIHRYEVVESTDESENPFSWPNWFGIINALAGESQDKRKQQHKIKFEAEQALENKVAPKEDFKVKYAQARKQQLSQEEITGNEIDGDVSSKLDISHVKTQHRKI